MDDDMSQLNDIRKSATPETKDLKFAVQHQENIDENGRNKLLIIGKTGTGKSTLCNVLTGNPPGADVFPVSAEATSCTQKTKFCDALFNGNQEALVSIIDTIGFDDPSTDHDAETVAELVEKIKNACDHINCFVLAVNGQNPRLDGSLVGMLRIFENIFGELFWYRMVVVFTRMPMDTKSIKKRVKSTKGKTDEDIAMAYMKEVRKKFGSKVPEELQFLFIDACYEEEDEEEKKAFSTAMSLLENWVLFSDPLPTKKIKVVETENQEMQAKIDKAVAKAEEIRKNYEESAENARKEKELLILKHKLEMETIEKQRLERENELLEKIEKKEEERIEAQKEMTAAQKKESDAKFKMEMDALEQLRKDELRKQQEIIKEKERKHTEELENLKRGTEELDQKARANGFSWWDVVPVLGAIRRLNLD